MKKIAVLAGVCVIAVSCTGNNEAIKQSLTNIKNEMVSMQTQMAELKITTEDLDRKIESNSENIKANANAMAEVRTELSYLSTEKENEDAVVNEPEPSMEMNVEADTVMIDEPAENSMAEQPNNMNETVDDAGQIIIIEDNFTDKSSLYSYAYELYKNGKYVESTAKFQEFLAKYPNDELSDNAVYWTGEIKYTENEYQQAANIFKSLLNKYPEGNKVPDAMLKLGYSQDEMGNKDAAISTLQKLVADYEGTNAAKLAKKRLESLGVTVE